MDIRGVVNLESIPMKKFNSNDYQTPKWLYKALDDVYHFDLDAACTRKSCLAPNGFYFDEGIDALKMDLNRWSEYERIFVNPPYSKAAGPLAIWLHRMWWTAILGRKLVVAILPATPNTVWFHSYIKGRANVFYPEGRIAFDTPDGQPTKSARHDTMIVTWNGFEGEINAKLKHR